MAALSAPRSERLRAPQSPPLRSGGRRCDPRRMRSSLLALVLGAAMALGCSANDGGSSFSGGGSPDGGGSAGGSGGGGQPGGGAGGGGGGSGGGLGIDGGVGEGAAGGPSTVSEVFAHSPTQLYKLDPTTKAITVVGTIDCGDSVIDIALDKNGLMYGTTYSSLVKIDKTTAKCTIVANGSYPNSLSFVPAGTVDPSVEALVGYNGASYVRIDPQSGSVTTVGQLSKGYASSGDIVSVIGGGTYLTVNGGPSFCGDCLVEVNPKTGDVVKEWGSVGHPSVFGLAFWAGSAYGFDDGGEVFQIDFGASTVTTKPIAVPNPPPGLKFYGAGSTTAAPVHPVN